MARGNRMAAGLLIGLAVGTVAGTLLSPGNGRYNRAVLQEKLGQLNEKVRRTQEGRAAEVEESVGPDDAGQLP